MIACVLMPRFQLTVAAEGRSELLQAPTALAPEPGGTQQIGEVSLSAEAFGVHPGMRLGEALARCPRLTLIASDPAGVADSWERLLVRLESIGAAVEPERPGLVCFDARGLLRLHGGLDGVLAAARRSLRTPARYGVAPSRFAAVAAATRARVRRPVIVSGGRKQAGEFLAPLPVALLRARPALAGCPRRSSVSGSAPSASWRRWRRQRWPTGSARLDSMPTSSRAAATARCGRDRRASSCARRSSYPRQRRASSSSGRSGS